MYFVFFWLSLFVASAQTTTISVATDEVRTDMYLRNAWTWYRLARSTENGMREHERSLELYEQALKSTNDPQKKIIAQKGIDQVQARLDNAHDIYRNLYEPVWWLYEEDPTVEWYDDLYMLALGNAWSEVDNYLEKEIEPQNHAVLVFAKRNPMLPEDTLDGTPTEFRLQLMRDEIIGFSEFSPSLRGLADDVAYQKMVLDYEQTGVFTSEQMVQMGNLLHVNDILVVSITIEDEIPETSEYADLVRVSLNNDFWKITQHANGGTSAKIVANLTSEGVGRNAYYSPWIGFLWMWMCFLLPIGIAKKTILPNLSKNTLFVSLVAFVVGSVFAEAVLGFCAEYQVDWGAATLLWEGDGSWMRIPYFPVMQWPFFFGIGSLIGPLVLLAWLFTKGKGFLSALSDDPLPFVQTISIVLCSGTLSWVFWPLIIGMGHSGLWVALPIMATNMWMSFIISKPFAAIIMGNTREDINLVAVLLLLASLVIVFPLGLFNGLQFVVCGILLGIGYWGYTSTKNVMPPLENPKVTLEAIISGTLEHPEMLQSHRDIVQQIVHSIQQEQSVVILHTESSFGLDAILLECKRQSQHKFYQIQCESFEVEPFAHVYELLDKMGVQRGEKLENMFVNSALEQMEGVITSLPGVEFLLGSLDSSEEADDAEMARSKIVRDIATLLHTHWKTQNWVLTIERADVLDMASREVFSFLVTEYPKILIILQQVEGSLILPMQNVQKLTMPTFYEEMATEFVLNCGISGCTEEFIHVLYEHADRNMDTLYAYLLHLSEQNVFIETQEHTMSIPPDLSIVELTSKLPTSMTDLIRSRIATLSDKEMRILACASLCGQQFYQHELVTALHDKDINVLSVLDKIEKRFTPPIVFDVPEKMGVFQFRTDAYRQILCDKMCYTNNIGTTTKRELARTYHKNIVQEFQEDFFPLDRMLHHLVESADVNLQTQIPKYLLKLLQEYKSKRAWPEIIQFVTDFQCTYPNLIVSDPATSVQIAIIKAQAYRFVGGQDNRNKGIAVLHRELKDIERIPSAYRFRLIQVYCDVSYASNPNTEVLTQFITEADILLANMPTQNLLAKIFLESYIVEAKRRVNILSNTADILHSLIVQVETIEASEDKNFVLGRLYNQYAWQQWMKKSKKIQNEEDKRDNLHIWNTTVNELFQTANRYMTEVFDHVGLGVNYGLQGVVYLYHLCDYVQGVEVMKKDVDVVTQYGFDSDVSSAVNKLSYGLVELAKTVEGDEKSHLLRDAEMYACTALDMGMLLEQTMNVKFAYLQLETVAKAQNKEVESSFPALFMQYQAFIQQHTIS